MDEEHHSVWVELVNTIRPYTVGMSILNDEFGDFRVETASGRPFVRVKIQKGHVGLYVLPIYYHPHILSENLKNQVHGKGTLKFKYWEEINIESIKVLMEGCESVVGLY